MILVATALGAWAALAAASPPADDAVRRLAVSANPSGMIYRVGLDVGHRLALNSDKPFRLIDPATGKTVFKDAFTGETSVLAQGGPEDEPASIYRIQVAAFSSAPAADAEKARLASLLGAPVVVRFLPDRGSWRVRAGESPTRGGLAPLMAKLRDGGWKGMWIVEEPASTPSGVTIRIVDASWDSVLTQNTRLLAMPKEGAFIKVQGKAYRGAIEVRVDSSGRLRAIDWVELESYLRGVVPSELGPEVWPQLEALKAQAVAARTYALANAGQFDEDGYDICATPRCQAYGGVGAEHPLSDKAVSQTQGELVSWQGHPIDALYTATCGGHTEDAKEIFPEQAAPYLVGVPCRAEDEALARTRGVITGATPSAIVTDAGEDVTRDVSILSVAGVFGSPSASDKSWTRPMDAAALRAWTSAVARLAGRPAPQGPPIGPTSLGKAALALTRDLGWTERTTVLLSDADLEAVLRDREAASLPEAERRALTYLVQQGALRPAPDGRWPLDRPPSAATIASALSRMAEGYKTFDLDEATVVQTRPGALAVVRGQGSATLPLASSPRLFTAAGPRVFPVRELQLWPGDRVRCHQDRDGRIDLLELRPPAKGVSDDRSAAVYAWEVRKTGQELQDAVDKRLAVGRLSDLRVARRGASGRIVELEVVGASGSTVVKGFDVRNLLDLRESLTVIELQRDAAGAITSAVFAGKGWGHGVGLCQVGAYGMAMRGSDYKQILSHYYPGTSIERGANAAPAGPGSP